MRASCVVSGLLAALSTFSGCDDGSGYPNPVGYVDHFDDHPTARRYADPNVPWPAREGTFTTRSVWFYDAYEPNVHREPVEYKRSLMAAVAMTTRVGVVFAPADRNGFDLAYAGIDAPWERVHISDVALADTGAIDATAVGDTVHVLVRELMPPRRLHYYRWTLGGTVSHEEVSRADNARSRWWGDRCADATVRVAPGGEVDILYRSDPQDQYEARVHHARRGLDGTWTHRLVADAASPSVRATLPKMGDVGCATSLTYDRDGVPLAAVLWQALPGNLVAPSTPVGAIGTDSPSKHVMQLALEPIGWVEFARSVPAIDGQTFPPAIDIAVHPRTQRLVVATGGHALLPQCGTVDAWAASSADGIAGFLDVDCPLAARAPVLLYGDRMPAAYHGAVFAHGVRNYDAAACLRNDDARPYICGGGHVVPGPAPFAPPLADADLPRFTASTPADGATGVPLAIEHIRFTPSRPPKAYESFYGTIYDITDGNELRPADGNESGLQLAAPLHEGHRYRVSLGISRHGSGSDPVLYEWQYLDRPPVFAFTAEGTYVPNPPPYSSNNSLVCSGTRQVDGTCVMTVEPVPGSLVLSFAEGNGAPINEYQFRDANDQPVAGATFSDAGNGEVRLTWTNLLASSTRHKIIVPDSLLTTMTSPLDAIDHTIYVDTAVGPPRFVSATPANGTTFVAVDAPITVTFSRPVAVSSGSITLRDGAGTQQSVSYGAQGNTITVNHANFAASTGYRLTVTSSVVAVDDSQAVWGTPIHVDFGTGATVGLDP